MAALIIWGGRATAQQPIQFSKPANADPAATANSFLPGPGHTPPSAFNAPNPLFGGRPGPSFDILPMGPQPIILNVNPQAQKAAQQRKNWTYLTPEEILAIPTPESILHVPDARDDSKLTPEERYLQRRDQQALFAATNSALRVDGFSWQNPDGNDRVFGSLDRDDDRDRATRRNGDSTGNGPLGPGGIRNPSSPFIQNSFFQNSGPDADRYQRPDSSWVSPFASPGPLPKPSLEQQAGMDRFRAQFLEAPPAPTTPAPSTFGVQQSPAPDPYMQTMPAFNPAGNSFKSLESDVAKPIGLTPLNGVTGPRPAAPKPVPLVQPPPWLQAPSPQNGNVPRRQF